MGKKCGICESEITEQDLIRNTPYDFLYTCQKHAEYSRVPMVEVVKKELGIISEYSESMRKCQICDNPLSEKETNSIEKTDTLVTCTAHREARKFWQIDGSKLWFEFKADGNPDANYTNTAHMKQFTDWRIKRKL